MATPATLDNQWNDFLFRQADPYAGTKYDILLKWLGPSRNEKVLVVGSGSGEFAAMLAQTGRQVHATDIDKASVELTEKTAQKFGVKLQTSVARLEDLSQSGYDIVVATDVVEHIEADDKAVEKLHQLTKPGGRLVITVPALQSLFGIHDEALGHFRRYDRESLWRLLKPHFTLLHGRYFGFFMIPIAFLYSRYLRKPYPVAKVAKGGWQPSTAILHLLLKLDKLIPFPLGTSLLFLVQREK